MPDARSHRGLVSIRPLQDRDLVHADRIFRLAFGTFLGLPDPETFARDADYVRTRWLADQSAALAAEVNGSIAGSNFVTRWGSVGFFGPLTVHPSYWDSGIAKKLLVSTINMIGAGRSHTLACALLAQARSMLPFTRSSISGLGSSP